MIEVTNGLADRANVPEDGDIVELATASPGWRVLGAVCESDEAGQIRVKVWEPEPVALWARVVRVFDEGTLRHYEVVPMVAPTGFSDCDLTIASDLYDTYRVVGPNDDLRRNRAYVERLARLNAS